MTEPRIALASVGLGRIQRGFERYFGDLFDVLKDKLDITVFKTGGQRVGREKVPRLFAPAAGVTKFLPFGPFGDGTEYATYKHDCVAYGLSLAPALIAGRYDVIHFIDPPMAKVFRALKRGLRLDARLVFTNGCNFPPEYYPYDAHIQHVAKPLYDEARAAGVAASRMTLATCGIHVDRFRFDGDREALRASFGIGPRTFVILAITAVKRTHKRVDHIIDEVAQLDGDFLLWIDGNPEDDAVVAMAREKLGERCRITHVPSADVPKLYAAADVFVHAALLESFGLSIVEALSTGLPVAVHDSAHFEWLVGGREGLVDMTAPGALAARLRALMRSHERSQARAQSVRDRFDWQSVAPAYIDMYRHIASTGPRES